MTDIARRFANYHSANPHVYVLFKKFAFAAAAEKRQYSADAVLHRMRWFTDIETSGDPFKINNNYAAYYGRLFMYDFPQHAGFFRTRTLHSEYKGEPLSPGVTFGKGQQFGQPSRRLSTDEDVCVGQAR